MAHKPPVIPPPAHNSQHPVPSVSVSPYEQTIQVIWKLLDGYSLADAQNILKDCELHLSDHCRVVANDNK